MKIQTVSSDFYSSSNKRLLKLGNLFEDNSCANTVLTPSYFRGNSNEALENTPYFITGGNDGVVRYWDLTTGMSEKSYYINAPNNYDAVKFNNACFADTTILQANEYKNSKLPKTDPGNFSEYLFNNGVSFHLTVQNEFDESLKVLKYCSKNSDASHKGVISDIIQMNVNNSNLMLTSSWDHTIKVWR